MRLSVGDCATGRCSLHGVVCQSVTPHPVEDECCA
jgi:hypothetical protein